MFIAKVHATGVGNQYLTQFHCDLYVCLGIQNGKCTDQNKENVRDFSEASCHIMDTVIYDNKNKIKIIALSFTSYPLHLMFMFF